MTASDRRANILLVDDRPENLLALEAILEPLGHRLVSVTSATTALKELLLDDFACILLDVQMPELDGFELAELIKQRERSQHIPIIFLTALSKEERHVFRGYSAGAVDYIFKPIDPDILRSKVVGLRRAVGEDAAAAASRRSSCTSRSSPRSSARARSATASSPTRCRRSCGRRTPAAARRTSTGAGSSTPGMSAEEAGPNAWHRVVHPDDLPAAVARREQTLAERRDVRGRVPLPRERRRVPLAPRPGGADPKRRTATIAFWVGTATDIHDRKLIEEQRTFIVAASDALARSLDYRETLDAGRGARRERRVADWCAVHIVEADGSISEVAVAHADPAKVTFARELQERYPPDPDAPTGVAAVIRTRRAGARARDHRRDARERRRATSCTSSCSASSGSARTCACRSRAASACSARSRSSRPTPAAASDADELIFAEELARRAASAIENARLYREAEERAQAARVLAAIGDGVAARRPRAAASGSGTRRPSGSPGSAERRARTAASRRASRAGSAVEPRLPVARAGEAGRAESVPLELGGRELWLSVSAVGYEDGTVYAFRDLTEERALESMRQDLVATVSHELRTPLAAIYGAALTLRRDDVELEARAARRSCSR